MSILIKGMKMPESCLLCFAQFGGWCYVAPPEIDERVAPTVEEAAEQGKPEWCPLVELPDHGDLIDRNMLIGGFADWYIQESPMYLGDNKVVAETIGDAMEAIEAAPVVIPAERSEE